MFISVKQDTERGHVMKKKRYTPEQFIEKLGEARYN